MDATSSHGIKSGAHGVGVSLLERPALIEDSHLHGSVSEIRAARVAGNFMDIGA